MKSSSESGLYIVFLVVASHRMYMILDIVSITALCLEELSPE